MGNVDTLSVMALFRLIGFNWCRLARLPAPRWLGGIGTADEEEE